MTEHSSHIVNQNAVSVPIELQALALEMACENVLRALRMACEDAFSDPESAMRHYLEAAKEAARVDGSGGAS